MTTQIQSKTFANYNLKFVTEKDNNDEYIALSLILSEELLKLIKSVLVGNDLKEYVRVYGEVIEKRNRRKVKLWILNSLGSNRDLFFDNELVEKGILTLKFITTGSIDEFISDCRQNMKRLIEGITQYQNLEINISFKINEN